MCWPVFSLLFFFFPWSSWQRSISAESIQSHKQSHRAGACHPIIDSVIYEFPFYGTTECFHLNHYWATWIVGINLPLCSAYNDRSSRGERVSVKTEESDFSGASHCLCICMPEYMKLCFLTTLFIGSCYSIAFFTHNLTISPTMYLLQWTQTSLLLKLLSVKET